MVLLASSTNIDIKKKKKKKRARSQSFVLETIIFRIIPLFYFPQKKKSKTGHFDPTGTGGREEEAETAFRNMTHIR